MKSTRSKGALVAFGAGLVIVAMLVSYYSIQAQPPGRGGGNPAGRGGMPPFAFNPAPMIMGDLESSWAYVSFELGLDDKALVRARKLYQESWAREKKLVNDVVEGISGRGSMRSARQEAQKINADLRKKLNDLLSPDQIDKLNKWEAERQDG